MIDILIFFVGFVIGWLSMGLFVLYFMLQGPAI